jgi:hypothetical protein
MNGPDSVFHSIVNDCHEDYVGLWSILRQVHAFLSDKSIVRQETLRLIKRLLLEAELTAGQLHQGGVIPWEMPAEKIVQRINREWPSWGTNRPAATLFGSRQKIRARMREQRHGLSAED